MTTRLVVVESPAKARTISAYLGDDFDVEASVGHIRDLPTPSELPKSEKKGRFAKFAVDVEAGFEPYYVVDAAKKKRVADLKARLKQADELLLATDDDREGEAIAWHLKEVLKPKVPVKRMVFHEITREAIAAALASPRDIDIRLVDAQETRRILDRLYGYEISPVLWRKVGKGLSAGRVQSVATRLVVERERERMAFVSADFWDVTAQIVPDEDVAFSARLSEYAGARVATGKDFDASGAFTSAAARAGVVRVDEATAQALVAGLAGQPFAVHSVDTKPYSRKPAAPFTTSTLQQEASLKLRYSAGRTMRVAQALYENGYITYMRTDSPALSEQAIAAARQQAGSIYGQQLVATKPRQYATKSKSAQEAHEAIRPAGQTFRTPSEVASQVPDDQARLYELIWKRTLASQMADAKGQTASLRLQATTTAGAEVIFAASGTVITFLGFLAAYEESSDTGTDTRSVRLPQLQVGDVVSAQDIVANSHATSPPARYTEASLIRALEERGIGRPSTYAATISVIGDRGYVTYRGQALVPSWLAFAVVQLLERHFAYLVDYDFTARMESDLDSIAAGITDRVEWLTRFYCGEAAAQVPGLRALVADLGEIDAREINSVPIGEEMVVRVGRYGPYIEGEPNAAGEPQRVSIPPTIAPDEFTPAVARELLATNADGGRVLGTDPEIGTTIVARSGRYGPYVTETGCEGKARTGSLLKTMTLESVTLADALSLLSLPRLVGDDPESGTPITAQNGRYGPYVKRGTESRSLASEEAMFTITLPEALALLAEPKRGRGGVAALPLRELGEDAATGKAVTVKNGRFGPYVTDGEINATLRKDDDPETVTLERACELLADRRARGPAKKRTTRTTARATTAKAAGTKKTATATAKATKATGTKKATKAASTRATKAKVAKPAAETATETVALETQTDES